MTRSLRLLLLVAVLGVGGLLSSRADVHHLGAAPASLTRARATAAPYRWHGYDIKTCQSTPIYGNACTVGVNWWTIQAHVAVWANGTSVVMARASGYPYCDASGYEISLNGCSVHGGGAEIYVVINWTNCILPFDLGCYSDFATMGFNRNGAFNSFVENWYDGLP